jgi:F0F1-type ATP synthase alpha subunit
VGQGGKIVVSKRILLDWEMFDILKETRHVPTCLYNKDGQVLIYPQSNISDNELLRLENFTQQGIYFHEEEKHIITSEPQRNVANGYKVFRKKSCLNMQ